MTKDKLIAKMTSRIAKGQSFQVFCKAFDEYSREMCNVLVAEFQVGENVVTILAETNDAAGNEFCARELFDAERAAMTIDSVIDSSERYLFIEDCFTTKKVELELDADIDDCNFAPQMTTQEIFLEYFHQF